MYNQFSTLILERLSGRKLPAILEERTGISERTWRNRIKDGWSPAPEELANFREKVAANITELMLSKEGWTEEEVQQIITRNPSWKAGIGLPTADLIFWFSPGYGEDYTESISVASQFDVFCHALFDAGKAGDVDGVRKVLLDCLAWIVSYCDSEEEEAEDVQELREKLSAANDLENLLEAAKPLVEQLLFLVLSCWDVEFCSYYTNGKTEPYPLFDLVMPRLSPDIEIEKGTNRFLREGKPPKRRIFEKSMSRFLDFLAVLSYWHKCRTPPERIPSVNEMATWFNEVQGRVVSWRDETTHLTASQLSSIWKEAVGLNMDGSYPGIPYPMFVAAHFFSDLLVREKGKLKSWIVCGDGYKQWWKRNLDRLTAKGLKFGSIPWPKCLTDQPAGNRSPESWRSSQSSGRSSQPLDSQ